MENKNELIRKNLHELRKIRGLSQAQLGKKIGITASSIGNYERGDRYVPGYLIHDLATALNVPDQFLLEGIPENISKSEIASNGAGELLLEVVSSDLWKKRMISKQIQTLQILHTLLEDTYLPLLFEEENDSNKVENIKQDIFDLFYDLANGSEINPTFDNFDENFRILYFTAMFFFDYIVELKGKNKEINGEIHNSFIEKAEDLIDLEGYASRIITYEYEVKNYK